MDRRVVLLADVAVLRLDDLAELRRVGDLLLLEAGGGNTLGVVKTGLRAQLPDAGLGEHHVVALLPRGLALAHDRPREPPPLDHIRAEDVAGGADEPMPFVGRQGGQQRAVGRDGA